MRQRNYIIRKRKNKHINYEERVLIEHLYNVQKLSKAEIARQVGKHRTTISREIKKGLVTLKNSDYSNRKEYVAEKAQQTYEMNATAKGPSLKIANDHKLSKYIENMIKKKYSPEVITEKLCKDKKFKTKIHWKTIYNYIAKNILNLDVDDLTYGEYKSNKKKKNKESLVKKINKRGRTIHDRPLEAEDRKELGHWEMDVVIGKKKGQRACIACTKREKK